MGKLPTFTYLINKLKKGVKLNLITFSQMKNGSVFNFRAFIFEIDMNHFIFMLGKY